MAVRILTDSTSYLAPDLIAEFNIKIVSLSLSFGNESMREIDISNEAFFKKMALLGIPTSSQPPVGELYDEMVHIVENGDNVCGIFLSSDMSGTFSTSLLAKNMVLEKYPEAKIAVVDSRSNCMQLGFSVLQAAKAAKAGESLETVQAAALENIKRSRFLFIPDNLEYLKKGGRIGGASALIASFFKIIPILTVEDGKTAILTKVRTKKKAVETMIDIMVQNLEDFGLGDAVVQHIDSMEEAKELSAVLAEKLGIPIPIADIGPVIGLHVGPGTVAITYYTLKDMRE